MLNIDIFLKKQEHQKNKGADPTNHGEDKRDLEDARMKARQTDLLDITREEISQKYKDCPEQLAKDVKALFKGLTRRPRCHCGRRLTHTSGGYQCPVHGYV